MTIFLQFKYKVILVSFRSVATLQLLIYGQLKSENPVNHKSQNGLRRFGLYLFN